MKSLPILGLLIALAGIGCNKFNGGYTPSCDSTVKSFATDVYPVVSASCTASGCHGAGSKEGPGPLLNYTQISAAKNQIRSAIVSGDMPRGSSLSTDQKNKIVCWIDAGALNN